MKGNQLVNIINNLFPEQDAYDWDNVGLQVGSLDAKVTGIVLALDVTKDVVAEANALGANWIISHHPLVFRPLTNLDLSTYLGQVIASAIRHNITLYAAHTNFDIAPRGLNHILANILELKNQQPLEPLDEERGLGRIGTLDKKVTLTEYLPVLKQQLQVDHIRVIGDESRLIQSVAIVGGSGSSVIETARQANVDVLITGDVTYHHAMDVVHHDFLVLDVGHHIEKLALPGLKDLLIESGVTVPVYVSEHTFDPFNTK